MSMRKVIRSSTSSLLVLAAFTQVACGPASLSDRVFDYRQAVAAIFGEMPKEEIRRPRLPLPDRRARRLDVGDQRMGPFDFLAIIGCPLSEVVAARNGPLGKVLEPTRRLDHEIKVLAAVEECLPDLAADRAARLRTRLEAKRSELPAHVWNAVWLDADLERFLSSRPATLFAGEDPMDGARQLARAARAVVALDVETLESAFHELRDDPPFGPMWVDLMAATTELERVAAAIGTLPPRTCDARSRRLIRVFREGYVPLQPALGELDRKARDIVEGLDALFRASARDLQVPDAMRSFGLELRSDESGAGVWSRFRSAVLVHAAAWQSVLEGCGVALGAESGGA